MSDERAAQWTALNDLARRVGAREGVSFQDTLRSAAASMERHDPSFPRWTGRGGIYSREQLAMIGLVLHVQLVLEPS